MALLVPYDELRAGSGRRQWCRKHLPPVAPLTHGCAGRVVHKRTATTLFPATAHRLVQGDQAQCYVAQGGYQKLLLAEQRALRVEDALKVGYAFLVLDAGNRQRALRRVDG